MNKVLLLFIFSWLVTSCGEYQTKEVPETFQAVEETEVTKPVMAAGNEIISYDYDALAARFFETNDDKIYVVNFWATWCKPCIQELPAFEQLNEKYKDDNVEVVLVSLDFPSKLESAVVPFINKRNIQSKVVLLDDDDANRWIPLVDEKWSGAIPVTMMVKNGARQFYEQPFTFAELETELKTIL